MRWPLSDLSGFARLITALDPWLDQIVVVGGWAHRLYRSHPRATELESAPLVTFDADIALPARLPRRAPDIRQLLAAGGFEEDFLGDDRPPATHYRLKDRTSGFYAEFLTPLAGGELTREGRRKATAQVAGVTSQQLRHLDVLLAFPWRVTLEPDEFLLEGQKTVQVANPVSFLAQKLMIHERRDHADRAKDILYIHDTLQVFGLHLEELREQWINKISPQLSGKLAKKVTGAPGRLFGKTTDAIREAAKMAMDRRLSSEAVRESCRYGLERILR